MLMRFGVFGSRIAGTGEPSGRPLPGPDTFGWTVHLGAQGLRVLRVPRIAGFGRTIQETLREVGRCTRDGITINTFMLERSRALGEFVALVTRLNRGRAFYASPERLGEYVLVDFVARRTKRVS